MDISRLFASSRLPLLTAVLGLFLAACGGSSGSTPAADIEQPAATTGTFGLFITDKPSEDFAEINLEVVKAVLIGGDDSQQVLFDVDAGDALREIDLLDLTNFNQPIVFGEVAVGTYTKLRLYIDKLELVPPPDPENPDAEVEPIPINNLPANGKIDLLDQDGFDVLPDATLLAEVDIDANKSIKVTGAGNSGKYQFRPVVKVQFTSDGGEQKLTRIEGYVGDPVDQAGLFALCPAVDGDNCVDVMTGMGTSFFDVEGLPTDFTGVALDSPVVVIGRFAVDPDIVLDAIVVELGGAATQVKGEVVSEPLNEPFLLLAEGGTDLTVDLQENTKYFNADGEVDVSSVLLGANVEIEGVLADADQIRAALVFVEDREDEQLSGKIFDEPATAMRTFMLEPTAAGDNISIYVMPEAAILFVDIDESTVETGDFADLDMEQAVEIFGAWDVDSTFQATEIIVEGPRPSP